MITKALFLGLTTVCSIVPEVGGAAADLIVSAADAKFVRVKGAGTYPPNPPPDTLTVIDASQFPPHPVQTVELQHSIHGPPQAVAITPDGELAFVSAPHAVNYKANLRIPLNFIQVIDLTARPPQIIDRVQVGSHPQALAVNPNGKFRTGRGWKDPLYYGCIASAANPDANNRCRLRITGLKALRGPGIELLEYLAARDGRPCPLDSKANDLWYWHTVVKTASPETAFQSVIGRKCRLISCDVMAVEDGNLGLTKGFLVRAPDGHALLMAQ